MTNVEVKSSGIEGLGIFATRAFRSGDRIRRVSVVREITADFGPSAVLLSSRRNRHHRELVPVTRANSSKNPRFRGELIVQFTGTL